MRSVLFALCLTAILGAVQARAEGLPQPLPAQALADALERFARSTGVQLVYGPELTRGLKSPGAPAGRSVEQTLRELLKGTGLTFEFVNETTVTILRPAGGDGASHTSAAADTSATLRLVEAQGAAKTAASAGESAQAPEGASGIPEILVKGSKILNMDVPRSRDDALPYVVFDRDTIRRSGAANVEQFLKTRLTMNTVSVTGAQGVTIEDGNSSQINLRGLGTNQTLILIDGRRASPNYSVSGVPMQPDLNGIPLAAIERIEVLPTTAGGIYGGSAVGGVVNVILRRDYAGVETGVSYGNILAADVPSRQVNIASGFSLEGGRTSILISGSYSDRGELLRGERDFTNEYYRRRVANQGYTGFFRTTPPYGATTNIRSANGSNLVLKAGSIALNSSITFVPEGYAGPSTDSGAALVANAGRYNLDFAPGVQSSSASADANLLSGATVSSVAATVRREFSSRIQAFVELSAARNKNRTPDNSLFGTQNYLIPAASTLNPFTQDIRVTFPVPNVFEMHNDLRTERVAGGVIGKLPADWTAEVDYVWGRNRNEFDVTSPAFFALPGLRSAVSGGTVNVLRDLSLYPFDAYAFDSDPLELRSISAAKLTTSDATARVAGPLPGLPAGSMTLLALVEHQKTKMFPTAFSLGDDTFIPARSQTVDSVYLEARIPLVAGAPGVRSLELQLSGRHDSYRTEGTGTTASSDEVAVSGTNKVQSTDPTIALKYQAWSMLMLRTSYGTGFLPPNVNQIAPNPTNISASSTAADPRRGNSTLASSGVPVTFLSGGNPGLQPEKSTTWSAGAVFTPAFLEGLRLSLDYSKIKKTDAIASLGAAGVLTNEAFLPGRVQRGAKLSTDPADWAGPVTFLDISSANVSTAKVEAYDVQLDYRQPLSGWGDVELFALGTWQTHYITRVTPLAQQIENAGVTNSNPLKFKASFGATWTFDRWTLAWNGTYFDGYWVYNPSGPPNATAILIQGAPRVRSQAYHDIYVGYRFGSSLELSLGLTNILDQAPAYDQGGYSYLGDPRGASYQLGIKKAW